MTGISNGSVSMKFEGGGKLRWRMRDEPCLCRLLQPRHLLRADAC